MAAMISEGTLRIDHFRNMPMLRLAGLQILFQYSPRVLFGRDALRASLRFQRRFLIIR
jgi:hypothetical protein